MRVDPRGQVVRAEMDDVDTTFALPPFVDADPCVQETRWQGTLHPSVASTGALSGFVPAFALVAKAKRFDDRFVAAMDRVAHDGLGARPGWRGLLPTLYPRLSGHARALVDAARSFVGLEEAKEGPERLAMRKLLRDFERDPFRSRPIGFYAESDALSRLFKHDRMLQSELAPDVAAALAAALGADADSYRFLLKLVEIVTGPRAMGSVEDSGASRQALLPPSDSLEGRLMKELSSNGRAPEGFRVIDELVARIRDGRLDTHPRAEDGFYAHKQHAMSALLAPDTPGLEVGPKYRKALEELFAALFTLTRETHVKQLEGIVAGPPPLTIRPHFSVEPLPELYARTAASYRFLREALTTLVGEADLRAVALDELDAVNALIEMESLFLGAEATARAELGQESGQLAHRARFAAFARDAERDPDLGLDVRVAVPLYQDARGRVRIAAVLGLETRKLRFSFVRPPKVEVSGEAGSPMFIDSTRTILAPITLECDVRVPPTREELRAICDREKSPDAIRAALIAD